MAYNPQNNKWTPQRPQDEPWKRVWDAVVAYFWLAIIIALVVGALWVAGVNVLNYMKNYDPKQEKGGGAASLTPPFG